MPLIDVNAALSQSAFTWQDLKWIRNVWPGPIVIKGVLTGDDARRSIDEGATAIVVSNHGGRQLDSVSPALQALPEAVPAVNGPIEVLVGSAVPRGPSTLKPIRPL